MNTLFIHILFVLLFSRGSICDDHPIHISKCQMEYLDKHQELEVILHVFIDDLEQSMEEEGFGPDYNEEGEKSHQGIGDFLQAHLKLSMDGTEIPMTFERKESSEDGLAFWCFLRAGPVPEKGTLEISYDLLMDLYADQKNIFNFIRPDASEEYFLFRNKKSRFRVKL